MRQQRDSIALFRRALAGSDKLAFDALMQRAEKHEEGKIRTSNVGKPVQGMELMEALFLSIMLEHEKEIIELRYRLAWRERML